MSANFQPILNGYSGQGAFKFWCQRVLPIVYDDSLSYYELLNKVVDYLNNTIADVAVMEGNVEAINTAYGQLEDWTNEKIDELETFINTYFDNLDVQEEINTKLDEMASNGSLTDLLAPFIPDLVTDWMDEHITPTTPIVDSSLSVSGAAADAYTVGHKAQIYRGFISALGYTAIADCVDTGYYMFTSSDAVNITDLPDNFPADSGGVVEVYTNHLGAIYWVLYSTTSVFIKYSTGNWRKIADYYNDYRVENNAMIFRSNIGDLGYTSFSDCALCGFYSFTTAQGNSMTDKPFDLNSGGIVKTWVAGSRVYQEIMTSSEKSFVRYGLTGNWVKRDRLLTVRFTNGSGDDNSDMHLDIDVPFSLSQSTRYQIGHCVDTSINADVWRIINLYLMTGNSARKLTLSGEYECALHLDGRSDFSGGITHGDEVDENITFIKDGIAYTSASDSEGYCLEYKIIRNSILYDPNDSTTPIAKHGVQYTFDINGMKIEQSIEWLVAENLTNCYLCMFPVLKAYSTEYFSDVDFKVTNNQQNSYSIQIPRAEMVTEFNAQYHVCSEVKIEKYPHGLTGGDIALITDNGGRGYNKLYFVVCSSGSSSIGEIWKSISHYDVR